MKLSEVLIKRFIDKTHPYIMYVKNDMMTKLDDWLESEGLGYEKSVKGKTHTKLTFTDFTSYDYADGYQDDNYKPAANESLNEGNINDDNYKKLDTIVTDGIKKIQSIMKSKGYKYSSSKQSALIEYRFEKDDKTFAVDGWHGTGKWTGFRSLFTLYSNHKAVIENPNDFTKVVGSGGKITDNHIKDQTEIIQKMIKFLERNA